ncbi:SDR family NAD(P)-dependent oxidoreductase [Ekhidna sp.]
MKQRHAIIISGANRGLGKALFDLLFEKESIEFVVSLSRRLSESQKELTDDPRFIFIEQDLSELSSQTSLQELDRLKDTVDKITFINNAAIIHPIDGVGNFNDGDLLQSIKVNIQAPMIIINYLIASFSQKELDIVNISSGAANRPIDGWSIYCSAKAYMKMFIESLEQQEQNNPSINAINIDPGVVDTDMQKSLRESNSGAFTRHQDFVNLKNEGLLQTPQAVAAQIIENLNI